MPIHLKTFNQMPPATRSAQEGSRGTNHNRDAKLETVVLPVELMEMVFSYLTPQERLGTAMISRAWADVARDPHAWAKLGKSTENVSFAQLQRLTKQDDVVQKFAKAARVASPLAACFFGALPGAIWMPVYVLSRLSGHIQCVDNYCATYEGQNVTQTSNWWDAPSAAVYGSDPRVNADCHANFGQPWTGNVSGPYGLNGECEKFPLFMTVGMVGGALFAGIALGSLASVAINRSRRAVENKQENNDLELGFWKAPPVGSHAETARKLSMLDAVISRLENGAARGEIRSMRTVLTLDLPEHELDAIGKAVLHRAVESGRFYLAERIVKMGVRPSLESIVWCTAPHLGHGTLKLLIAACKSTTTPHPSDGLPQTLATEVLRREVERSHGHGHTRRSEQGDSAICRTLLDNASTAGQARMINDASHEDGRTLLHLSTQLGEPAWFVYALNHGGDVTIRDADGQTALNLIEGKPDFQNEYRIFQRQQADLAQTAS